MGLNWLLHFLGLSSTCGIQEEETPHIHQQINFCCPKYCIGRINSHLIRITSLALEYRKTNILIAPCLEHQLYEDLERMTLQMCYRCLKKGNYWKKKIVMTQMYIKYFNFFTMLLVQCTCLKKLKPCQTCTLILTNSIVVTFQTTSESYEEEALKYLNSGVYSTDLVT